MSEVMPEVMERNVGNEPFLIGGSLSLQGTEPVLQTCIGQPSAALGDKDKGTPLIAFTILQVGIQISACLVGEINVPRFTPFASHMQPSTSGANMRVSEPKLHDVGHAAARKVAQRKKSLATSICLVHQFQEDGALHGREHTGSLWLSCCDDNPTNGIARDAGFLLNEPLTKVREDRFDTLTVARTICLSGQMCEIAFDERGGERRRIK
jgi:hypothetical protein